MSVYRCNHCKHIGEYPQQNEQTQAKCANCGHDVTVYDTVYFIKNILNRWAAAVRELNALQSQEQDNGLPADSGPKNSRHNPLDNIKLSDTDILANERQHKPLENWFRQKQIVPTFDYSAVDMSGYFDEAAEKIGTQFDVFKDILGKITWAYRNNHSGLNLDLKKYSQKEAQQINTICREFYSHTLFSRYNYQKQDKLVHLKLQSATPIRQFFGGEWLEWFALNAVLTQAKKRGKNYAFSCARSAEIRFANEDLHELDVVFLTPQKPPVIIECKTGEYRRDLDKYLNLRKRLNIPAENFALLVTDVNEAQAKSLSAMYQLTFVTPDTLAAYLDKVM